MTHPYKAGWRDSFIRVFFDDKKEEKDGKLKCGEEWGWTSGEPGRNRK